MILVTGGTGLVGSHLLFDLVNSGKKVRAIYRSQRSLQNVRRVFLYYVGPTQADRLFEQIEWVHADVRNLPDLEEAFRNIEIVYHCAALVSFDPAQDSKLRKINIGGTANIVNLCIENKIKKLCYVSSIATLDQIPGEEKITENCFWNKEKDHDTYSITKYGAEMEVWRGSQEGIPIIIVNPGVIIGPGLWEHGSGRIFKKITAGLQYYVPKITGFVGVWDVVQVMQQLVSSNVKNEQFVVVAESRSFRKIFELVAENLQRPVPQKKLKPWMVKLGWVLEQLVSVFLRKKRVLTRRSAKSLYKKTYYDSQKVQGFLKHSFEPLPKVVSRTAGFFQRDFPD